MLLPSAIQRAEDLVGMEMPTVGLPCASAPGPSGAVTATPRQREREQYGLQLQHASLPSVQILCSTGQRIFLSRQS